MFILSQLYLFNELKTGLSIGSFYLSYPFRKVPEWGYKFDTAEKNLEKSHISNMPEGILNSNAFFSD